MLSHSTSAPSPNSLGIPSSPPYAPSTIPTATARLALSPPTSAFALAASARFKYLQMKYTDAGSVPSVGLALPTLIGSVLPTSLPASKRSRMLSQ